MVSGASGRKEGCGRWFEVQYSVMASAAEEMACAYALRGKTLLSGSDFA